MNYGYNEDCKGWIEDRKWILAEELQKVLNIEILNFARTFSNFENDGHSPYIEVDGSYGGVRIRRITHLSEEEHDKLIKEADRIYDLVMQYMIRE